MGRKKNQRVLEAREERRSPGQPKHRGDTKRVIKKLLSAGALKLVPC